ncbi:hypothetical protein EWM64_g6246, partial [Hericium alpestre]
MDEKGVQLGGGRGMGSKKYMFGYEQQDCVTMKDSDLELVTVIECVCTDGTSAVPPGFVFKGVKMCTEWFLEDEVTESGETVEFNSKIMLGTSENGWTSEEICLEWMRLVFVLHVKVNVPEGETALLIYDGHNSHSTGPLVELALENNIVLYRLPPHTTHRLQPLDVGVFSPLQIAWEARCNEVMAKTGSGIGIQDVVAEYMTARKASFTEKTISAAWTKSGIRPLNPDIFIDSDFAPSHLTSTQAHFPSSFPALALSIESNPIRVDRTSSIPIAEVDSISMAERDTDQQASVDEEQSRTDDSELPDAASDFELETSTTAADQELRSAPMENLNSRIQNDQPIAT